MNAWDSKIASNGWRAGGAGTSPVVEKSTGEAIAEIGIASTADVRIAAAAAREAQRGWATTRGYDRAAVLRRAATAIHEMAGEFETWLVREGGQISANAQFEIAYSEERLLTSAALSTAPIGTILAPSEEQESSYAFRVPVGVVGVIAPWNAPLALAIRAVAPALALGNAVVLKPDTSTAVCGGLLIAEAFERAGLPDGLLHVIPGGPDVGSALVNDRDVPMISFTGSTSVGRIVGADAGRALKRVSLELGGNNATIVLADADLEAIVSAASFGSFINQGQVCMATGRHLVHESVADDYIALLAEHARALRVGDPYRDPTVALGPLINATQRENVSRIVDATVGAGASRVAGGPREDNFYAATVLANVTPTMAAFREEIFGPVAPVTTFASDDEAVALANDSEYGLAASIQTADTAQGIRIARRIRAGMVHINDQTINDQHTAPMGGFGASGNGSRFGPQSALEEFTQWQWLTVLDEPKRYPF